MDSCPITINRGVCLLAGVKQKKVETETSTSNRNKHSLSCWEKSTRKGQVFKSQHWPWSGLIPAWSPFILGSLYNILSLFSMVLFLSSTCHFSVVFYKLVLLESGVSPVFLWSIHPLEIFISCWSSNVDCCNHQHYRPVPTSS